MKSISYSPFSPTCNFEQITLPKSKWKKVKPPRFLYHLSYRNISTDGIDLRRYNIAKEGLWGIESGRGGVWANVQYASVGKMWPIVIDGFECSGDWGHFIEGRYDVWRIDTMALNNQWYYDPVMDDDECKSYYIHQSDYLFTEYTIQPHALRLFTFVSHVDTDAKHRFHLTPVMEINQYIIYKRSNR